MDARARSGVNPGDPPSAPIRPPETLASAALGEIGVRDGRFCDAETLVNACQHALQRLHGLFYLSQLGLQQPAKQRNDVADQRVYHTTYPHAANRLQCCPRQAAQHSPNTASPHRNLIQTPQ